MYPSTHTLKIKAFGTTAAIYFQYLYFGVCACKYDCYTNIMDTLTVEIKLGKFSAARCYFLNALTIFWERRDDFPKARCDSVPKFKFKIFNSENLNKNRSTVRKFGPKKIGWETHFVIIKPLLIYINHEWIVFLRIFTWRIPLLRIRGAISKVSWGSNFFEGQTWNSLRDCANRAENRKIPQNKKCCVVPPPLLTSFTGMWFFHEYFF